ncbi:hypothetical protein G3N56_08870 [Desulfovibrio sulfodismutans]|uniref:Uncharacterized protein n=1 Tax=Desulfolutivibrio sulfodismutans TaxID=63561 RepID=A0A7K3NKZ6_9BACT|nr:hypothetical protein [Desulfolutivibrio sulfodismutans]NDY56852.1 hypothetical protein [Desulfolutivibrio sulfodismutans]QLA13883.1 hypothetical protein GD606_17250 [Desulfolutivibrio sulfodismutans DSM 3696]
MELSNSQVLRAVVALFKKRNKSQVTDESVNIKLFCTDVKYNSISEEVLSNILENNICPFHFDPNHELKDCDDHALYTKLISSAWARKKDYEHGPAVGIMIDTKHAMNICVDFKDGEAKAFVVDTTKKPTLFLGKIDLIESQIINEYPIRLVLF